MELIVIILFIALIIGLIIRNKGDNTMDTLSKGCGCMIILFFLFMFLAIWFTTNPESFNETFSV